MNSSAKIKCFLWVLVFALLTHHAYGQDIIHKKNGKEIRANIVELGASEIKYRLFDQPDGPIYTEDKENIQKIVFREGHTEFYGAARMDDVQQFEGQNKGALKVAFLGPLLGYTSFVYERNVRPGRSWEAKATIIGLGIEQEDKARGFLGTAAYKFYKKPSFYTSEMKRTHLLQGAYIKPEVFLGYNSYDEYEYSPTDPYYQPKLVRKSSAAGGLLLNLGKEWVFGDAFVLDLSVGFGYGSGNSTRSIYILADEGKDVGFAVTGSINIGWTIK